MEDKYKKNKKSTEVIHAYHGEEDKEIKSDVLGSYTGMSEDNEKPIQDADDL